MSTSQQIFSALVCAISSGHDDVSEQIIRSPMYEQVRHLTSSLSASSNGGFYVDEPVFHQGHVTPLLLAAQNNQFRTVRLLVAKGETIEEPHSFTCRCDQCRAGGVGWSGERGDSEKKSRDHDDLLVAQNRLNTFRALCSEAYIVATSRDPLQTAFKRSEQMRTLTILEKNFLVSTLKLK